MVVHDMGWHVDESPRDTDASGLGPGLKYDDGKTPWGLFPVDVLHRLVSFDQPTRAAFECVIAGRALSDHYEYIRAYWDLYDGDLCGIEVIRETLHVLEFGAEKYGPNNWQNVENAEERYYAACLRHLHAMATGEDTDPESGLPHRDHAACNLVFLIWLALHKENGT